MTRANMNLFQWEGGADADTADPVSASAPSINLAEEF